ncbi:MAG: EthD family reductase [Acidiphilium sp.]
MIAITVLYPKTATSRFDTGYYHGKHMKLVADLWGSMGLEGASVLHGTTGPDGKPPAFAVITTLRFASMEAFGKAAAEHGPAIMGDIPNFTDVEPVMQFNDIAD